MIDYKKLNESQKTTLEKFANGEIVSRDALGEYLYGKLTEINGHIITIESIEEIVEDINLKTKVIAECDLTDDELKLFYGDDYKNDENLMERLNDGKY